MRASRLHSTVSAPLTTVQIKATIAPPAAHTQAHGPTPATRRAQLPDPPSAPHTHRSKRAHMSTVGPSPRQHAGRWYAVCREPEPRCTCAYCRGEDAIGGRRDCTHLVAFLAYWRLVEERLTELVVAGAVGLRNLHTGRPELTPTYVPMGLPTCRVVVQATAHGVRCVLPEAEDLDVVAYGLVGERVAVAA